MILVLHIFTATRMTYLKSSVIMRSIFFYMSIRISFLFVMHNIPLFDHHLVAHKTHHLSTWKLCCYHLKVTEFIKVLNGQKCNYIFVCCVRDNIINGSNYVFVLWSTIYEFMILFLVFIFLFDYLNHNGINVLLIFIS